MAAIDKIYGTTKEYDIFYKWIHENNPNLLVHFYQRDGYNNMEDRPITNFPESADKWLMESCPLQFVKDRITEQYDGDI